MTDPVSGYEPRRRALLALLLLVPVPTLGGLTFFVWAPGAIGQAVFFAAKAWILILPLVWLTFVERRRPSLSPLPKEGRGHALRVGAGLGLFFGAAIVVAYLLIGDTWIDADRLRSVVEAAGFATPGKYLGMALYITFVNSLLEEYVWRWFVYRRCEVLAGKKIAVPLAALLFTFHHIVVFSVQLGTNTAILASFGVFVGGAIWSWCYGRFRSIWPGWVSHVAADVAGLAVGWHLIFQN